MRSPEVVEKRVSSGGNGSAAPLVLFAVACGLFLINPGTNDSMSGHAGHTISKREVHEDVHSFHQYVPRITAMVLNLIVFLFLYKVLGLFVGDERESVEDDRACLAQSPPGSFVTLRLWHEYARTLVFAYPRNNTLGSAYLAASKSVTDPKMKRWFGLKIIQNSLHPDSQDNLLSGLMLVNSKILVKSTLSKLNRLIEKMERKVKLHPLFEFGVSHIYAKNPAIGYVYPNAFTTEVPNGLVGNVMQCVKHECITRGVTRLLVNGDRNTSTWFKNCLRAVVSEVRKGEGVGVVRDHVAEWWACVMWVEAEWLVTRGNGNNVHLEKLFRVIDSVWKNHVGRERRCVEQPVFKAVYYCHRVRREIITVSFWWGWRFMHSCIS